MHSKALANLVIENSRLFWYIPADKKKSLSEEAVVETILNYGDLHAIKKLFDILSIDRVAEIFYKQTHLEGQKSGNYHELVRNYFDLYFKKHVRNYPFR